MKSIGFIGLGLMGSGFTKRLRHLGYRVVGYDIDPARIEQARQWGVEGAASPKALCSEADTIGICVTMSHAVREAVSGDGGLISAGNLSGKTIIDFSTTEMAVTFGGFLEITSAMRHEDRLKLFHDNAKRIYRIETVDQGR